MKKQVIAAGLLLSGIVTAFALVNAPSGLVNNGSGCSGGPVGTCFIKPTWTDNSSNETGFKIESRSTVDGVSYTAWTQVGTVGANVKTYTYTQTKGSCSQTRQFRVRAYNATENSAYSGIINVNVWGTSSCA